MCENAISREAISDKLKSRLPETLKNHVEVLSYRNGRLMLSIDAKEYAMELRYFIPTLRDELRDPEVGFPGLAIIDFKVKTDDSAPVPIKKIETERLASKV